MLQLRLQFSFFNNIRIMYIDRMKDSSQSSLIIGNNPYNRNLTKVPFADVIKSSYNTLYAFLIHTCVLLYARMYNLYNYVILSIRSFPHVEEIVINLIFSALIFNLLRLCHPLMILYYNLSKKSTRVT